MASSSKNRFVSHRFPAHLTVVLSSVILLLFTASLSYSQDSLDSDIGKALRKVVKCEKIEVKTKNADNKTGKLSSLLIKLVAMAKQIFPADYVTVQYANPNLDMTALRKSNNFKVNSYSNFKIGMLVSEQTVKNEFVKSARRLNFQYNKFSIKFTPPYIELEFDIPAGAIPLKDRKLVEKFIRNKRLEGYAALRLEIRDNKIIAAPVKVILNHFLLPTTLVAELKKQIKPIYNIPRIRPFDYNLTKVAILKQQIFLSN
ncbi:hypothetical protein OR1_00420 [Geobacter sp. OR-1]|nr:hypothetical protein OR1_00420 [Geobacter sp. OR-1]